MIAVQVVSPSRWFMPIVDLSSKLFLTVLLVAGFLVGQSNNLESRIERIQPIHLLTSDSKYYDYWPTVAPNGRQVIFARNDAQLHGKWRLWKVSLHGDQPQPLIASDFYGDFTRPSWSHDGRRIAFRASHGEKGGFEFGKGVGGIWLLTLDNGAIKPLTDGTKYNDIYPEWSPDDKWLAISRSLQGNDNFNIWTLTLDGRERRITTRPKYDGKSTVSPNGKEIAFASNRDRTLNIWIVKVERGEESARQFTYDQGRAPAWSPDGKWIAFESDRSNRDHYAIYIKPTNGGPATQVTDDKSAAQHPVWTPDGKSIIFDAHSKEVSGYIAMVDVHEIAR